MVSRPYPSAVGKAFSSFRSGSVEPLLLAELELLVALVLPDEEAVELELREEAVLLDDVEVPTELVASADDDVFPPPPSELLDFELADAELSAEEVPPVAPGSSD